jgi:hypothetical protein
MWKFPRRRSFGTATSTGDGRFCNPAGVPSMRTPLNQPELTMIR